MKKHLYIFYSLIIISGTIAVADDYGINKDNLKPIHIKSDEMEIRRKEQQIIFTGRVTAQQGDIQIYSDKLIANYSETSKEILSIIATGSAKVVDKDRIALCGEIFMDNVNRIITMRDNPKLWEGEDLLEGEEIIYYIDEDRFKVKSASASIRTKTIQK